MPKTCGTCAHSKPIQVVELHGGRLTDVDRLECERDTEHIHITDVDRTCRYWRCRNEQR